VRLLERDLQSATAALKRVAADKTVPEPVPIATSPLISAPRAIPPVKAAPAGPSQEAFAAANQKIAELQSKLSETQSRLNAAEKNIEARDEELANMRTALAAAESRPSISAGEFESARRELEEARKRLAGVTQELAESRQQLGAAREFESRVRQLEAEKASYSSRPAETEISKEEFARLTAAHAAAENKLSTVLRSFTLLTKERDELRARVGELTAKLSSGGEKR
jgi:chromosome segregation ATPase